MKSSKNRNVALLLLAAVSLSFIGFASPVAAAPTLDITGLRISPNPGYACENTTISFNVTNNLGTMVDLVDVHVDAKSAVGGMSWQSNITLFANGATSFQSFTWTYPPEGTYDLAVTVIGAGQIAQKSGVYTVLPCAAHRYIGWVTIVKSALAPDSATVAVELGNDGHAPAYNTTVAVQATGPYPDSTRYFIGSTVVPLVDAGSLGRVDIFWQKLPGAGVYNVSAMAIDDNGVIADLKNNVTTLQSQPVMMNSVRIVRTVIDPYPPTQGQDSNVTVWLMFEGNWSGIPATVKVNAVGQSSYMLFCVTFTEVIITNLVPVNFTWPAGIEPGEYSLDISVFGFEPTPVTAATTMVKQMPRQKQWLPANFRLELKGLRMSPYPPLPGQNSTVTVEVANTGDADAPPAKLTVTAEGPAFYNLGTRTTPSTSFGTVAMMDFNWTQPIVPGEYTIRAFLEDAGGNQSELRKTFPMPHVLESNLSIANGSAVYNYYYYGGAPNGTSGQNITVTVKETGEGAASGLSMSNPAVAGAAGVAVGGAISAISVLIYAFASKKGYDYYKAKSDLSATGAQSNPMYQDGGMSGQNPMYEERKVHAVHRGEHIDEPPAEDRALVGGALPGGAVISSAVSSGVRESPSRPSTGQTSIRESPTRATGVTDADGDASSAARMAIATKGLPGKSSTKKENEAAAAHQRATGGGEELPKESVDYGGVPPVPDQASNPIPGVGIVVKRTADYGSAVRESPSRPSTGQTSIRESPTLTSPGPATEAKSKVAAVGRVETPLGLQGTRESPTRATNASTRDSVSSVAQTAGSGGDDMPTESWDQSRKGWDGTIKGVKVDEAGPEAASKKGYDYYQAQSQLNSAGKLRESPTKASGLRESPTRATAASTRDSVSSVAQTAGSSPAGEPLGVRESPTRASGLRESPTLPSKGQTSVRESPTEPAGIRESPTRASGLRESPTLPSKGQTSVRESPTQGSDFAIKEQGVKSSQASPPIGDLDGDGAPDLRAQNNGTTRSNRTENPVAPDGPGGDLSRKGWDGTVKGTTKADEPPEGTNASNPIPGVGIVVKHNPPTPPKTK